MVWVMPRYQWPRPIREKDDRAIMRDRKGKAPYDSKAAAAKDKRADLPSRDGYVPRQHRGNVKSGNVLSPFVRQMIAERNEARSAFFAGLRG